MELRQYPIWIGERICVNIPEFSVFLSVGVNTTGILRLSYLCEPHLGYVNRFISVVYTAEGGVSYIPSRLLTLIGSCPAPVGGVYHVFEEVS